MPEELLCMAADFDELSAKLRAMMKLYGDNEFAVATLDSSHRRAVQAAAHIRGHVEVLLGPTPVAGTGSRAANSKRV